MAKGKPENDAGLCPRRRQSEEFLWHLTYPWANSFSHDHWWSGDAKSVEPIAAIWEIVRRHPITEWCLIGAEVNWEFDGKPGEWAPDEAFLVAHVAPYWQKRRKQFLDLLKKKEFSRLCCRDYDLILSNCAEKTWEKLSSLEKKGWKESLDHLESQHGFVNRFAEINSVTVIPDLDALPNGALDELKRAQRKFTQENGELINNFLQKYIPEDTICAALGSHRITICFDPNFPNIQSILKKRLGQIVSRWKKTLPMPKSKSVSRPFGRLHFKKWLKLIAAFEMSEQSRKRAILRDDQLFARYRRLIGGWRI
jgi:hypothetical protein